MERHARFFTLWHASTVKCVLFLGGWIGDPFWSPVPPENQMLPKKCSSLQLYKHKLPINRPRRPLLVSVLILIILLWLLLLVLVFLSLFLLYMFMLQVLAARGGWSGVCVYIVVDFNHSFGRIWFSGGAGGQNEAKIHPPFKNVNITVVVLSNSIVLPTLHEKHKKKNDSYGAWEVSFRIWRHL